MDSVVDWVGTNIRHWGFKKKLSISSNFGLQMLLPMLLLALFNRDFFAPIKLFVQLFFAPIIFFVPIMFFGPIRIFSIESEWFETVNRHFWRYCFLGNAPDEPGLHLVVTKLCSSLRLDVQIQFLTQFAVDYVACFFCKKIKKESNCSRPAIPNRL